MRLHHIALRTADVRGLAVFYREMIGLPDAERPSGGRADTVWLSAGAVLVMIEPREAGEAGVPNGSMELVAFAISPADRACVEERLARGRVVIEARTAFTLYLRDPDGRRVGLSHFPEPAG